MSSEKPRSDIFPFLDRVTYLCLGDIVYTGATRMMLDYFRHLGFPCPELENPLMFYLCLATVDRRSHERFIESTNQIAALVDQFRMEGRPFRKYAPSFIAETFETEHRLPLTAYGHPSTGNVFSTLLSREWSVLFRFPTSGRSQAFVRLALLPTFYFLLWIFYFAMGKDQQSYASRNGLLFNCLAGSMFMSVITTTITYPAFRTRYYQESRDGLYYGPLFVLARNISSIPLSILSVLGASAIVYFGLSISTSPFQWFLFASALWAVYFFMEQQTMAILMLVKSSYNAAIASIFLGIIYLTLSSAMMRSIPALPEWLYYLTYVTQSRYAAAFLNEQHFRDLTAFESIANLTTLITCPRTATFSSYGCRYVNGTHYLRERYHVEHPPYEDDLRLWMNFSFNFLFAGVMFVATIILHIIPLPAFVKSKFRD